MYWVMVGTTGSICMHAMFWHCFIFRNKIKQLILKQKELQRSNSECSCGSPTCCLKTPPAVGTQSNGVRSLHQGIHQSVFMSSLSSPTFTPPPNDLPHCWDQHCKLLPSVREPATKVAMWSSHVVASFVATLPGCQNVAQKFEEQVGVMRPLHTCVN
jgi:hypothetical protein